MKTLNQLLICILILSGACHSKPENNSNLPPNGSSSEPPAAKSAGSPEDLQPTTTTIQDTLYQFFGTEPFWGMVVAKPLSVYTSADGDTLFLELTRIRQAQARPEGYVQVFEFGNGQSLVLRQMNNCSCSDGMSDREHPLQATLILKEKVLEGCGRTPSYQY